MTLSNLLIDRTVLDWVRYVALSGNEGRRWVKEYQRPEYSAMAESCTEALKILRQKQLQTGRDILARVEEGLLSLDHAPPSILCVMERWYHGAIAYYYYCIEDFSRAVDALLQAHEAVTRGIEIDRFLVPIADHCADFRFQRIRIARNQHCWAEILEHVEVVRAMAESRAPLCTLSDGTGIYAATLEEFYASIPELDDGERVTLRHLLDYQRRWQRFNLFLAEVYSMPGFVIPYP